MHTIWELRAEALKRWLRDTKFLHIDIGKVIESDSGLRYLKGQRLILHEPPLYVYGSEKCDIFTIQTLNRGKAEKTISSAWGITPEELELFTAVVQGKALPLYWLLGQRVTVKDEPKTAPQRVHIITVNNDGIAVGVHIQGKCELARIHTLPIDSDNYALNLCTVGPWLGISPSGCIKPIRINYPQFSLMLDNAYLYINRSNNNGVKILGEWQNDTIQLTSEGKTLIQTPECVGLNKLFSEVSTVHNNITPVGLVTYTNLVPDIEQQSFISDKRKV